MSGIDAIVVIAITIILAFLAIHIRKVGGGPKEHSLRGVVGDHVWPSLVLNRRIRRVLFEKTFGRCGPVTRPGH